MAHGISGRGLNGASFDVRVSTATGLMQLLDPSPLHTATTVTHNLFFYRTVRGVVCTQAQKE